MQALAIAILLGLFCAAVTKPVLDGGSGELQSPVAASAEDPRLGVNAVFPPVPSCLSSVILVIYVQSLDMLGRLSTYQDMYSPYVAGIEFYVDGTWCDPRETSKDGGYPCYGEQLNRSTLPEEVHVVDRNGGGWMMQRSLIDAVKVPRELSTHAGYLFMTDDVLLNIGQLSRAVNESGCDVIWRSTAHPCENVLSGRPRHYAFKHYHSEARNFFEQSDERFRSQLTQNMGSPSTYCMGTQNDFLYMPTSMAASWANVAQQMTDVGLGFTFAFYTAIFGIARMDEMVVLRSQYLPKEKRATVLLADADFEGAQESYCWHGAAAVGRLLAMHIIHPNKLSTSATAQNFALTLNPPKQHVALNSSNSASNSTENDHHEREIGPSAFWCAK